MMDDEGTLPTARRRTSASSRGIGKVSRIHRRKPQGKPMPRRTARANAKKSAVRAHVEHPFAHQKGPTGLVIRTIGIARATATVTLANMAYNMKRWCWLDRRSLPHEAEGPEGGGPNPEGDVTRPSYGAPAPAAVRRPAQSRSRGYRRSPHASPNVRGTSDGRLAVPTLAEPG